jgi:hypothetical protein
MNTVVSVKDGQVSGRVASLFPASTPGSQRSFARRVRLRLTWLRRSFACRADVRVTRAACVAGNSVTRVNRTSVSTSVTFDVHNSTPRARARCDATTVEFAYCNFRPHLDLWRYYLYTIVLHAPERTPDPTFSIDAGRRDRLKQQGRDERHRYRCPVRRL